MQNQERFYKNMKKINSEIQFVEKKLLNFVLNSTEKITIFLDYNDIIDCCYWASFFFVQYNHRILLTRWEIQDNIERFIKILDLAIHNKLPLNFVGNQDIGYLWNFICKKKNIKDEYSDETFNERLKFKPYLVFNDHNFATWIYNDHNGDIVLKITPLFPKGRPRNRISKYNTFLHWMKKYKPKFVCIIQKNIAKNWLDQANKINDIIKNNIHAVFIKNE